MLLPGWLLGLLLGWLLEGGCTGRSGPRRPTGDRQGLPRLLWSTQLDGNPWPLGQRGPHLYVWSLRRARAGFLFPIRLQARDPTSGQLRWRIPIRPWLRLPGDPASWVLARSGGTLGTWVKGNVVRVVRESDGEDAWSLPRAVGLAAHGPNYTIATEHSVLLLDATEGRERAQIELGADVKAQLLSAPGLLLLRARAGISTKHRGRRGARLARREEGEYMDVFNRRGTQPAGVDRRPNAVVIPARALKVGRQELVAVDIASRRVAWRRRPDWLDRPLAATPRSVGDLLLVPVWRTPGRARRTAHLIALRARDGHPVWQRTLPAPPPARSDAAPTEPIRWSVAGDLLLWPAARPGCLTGLAAETGARRFVTCGLHSGSLPVAVGPYLFALGESRRASEAVRQGLAWYAVDYPLLTLDPRTGKQRPVTRWQWQGRRRAQVPVRALRLPLAPRSRTVLHLLGRDRFLTALQVAPNSGNP